MSEEWWWWVMVKRESKRERVSQSSQGQLERHIQAAPPHCKWLSTLLLVAGAPHSQWQLFRTLPSLASLWAIICIKAKEPSPTLSWSPGSWGCLLYWIAAPGLSVEDLTSLSQKAQGPAGRPQFHFNHELVLPSAQPLSQVTGPHLKFFPLIWRLDCPSQVIHNPVTIPVHWVEVTKWSCSRGTWRGV